MSDSDIPPGFEILSDSGAEFGGTQETLIDRRPSRTPPKLLTALALAAALVLAAAAVAWLRNEPDLPTQDGEAASADPASTTAPPDATDSTGATDSTDETTAARPSRTTLPQPTVLDGSVRDLPPVRPAAEIVGTLPGDPTDAVVATLFRLDLVSGTVTYVSLEGLPHTLAHLGRDIVLGIDRDVVRVDAGTGTTIAIAEDVAEFWPAFAPPGVVAVTRSGNGLLARVIGPDGVFRSAVQMPNEAIVHGALGDHVIATLAGRVMALDGRNEALNIGAGRLLAVGDGVVVRLSCESTGCEVVSTDYPIAANATTERIADLPPELLAASPDRWAEQGVVSPDGGRLAVRLRHGNGQPSGVVVIDLDENWGRHSPEVGIDLGNMAWAPDSRFLLYTFDNDVMVWDTQAETGQLPSARVSINEPLDHLILRTP